jgi:nicotinamide phosphoribosyltransferase
VLHNSVRVIQGDGITIESIKEILDLLEKNGYSADNVTFGCGGYLLQQLNRDTQRFAMKASSVVVGGDRRNICKTPKTDMSKQSKSGRLAYVKFIGQDIKRTITVEQFDPTIHEDLMETVYRDGEILKVYTFDEVRANATKSL